MRAGAELCGCARFGPAPLPEVLAWVGTYTGHVTLYFYDHEPVEGAHAKDHGE